MSSDLNKLFKTRKSRRFFVLSTFGELLDVAIALKNQGEEVVLCVPDKEYSKIGEGIVKKADNWHEYMGKGYIFIVDGCENASLQDWLREKGEFVVGTNETMAEMENDRQKGQELFKKIYKQPKSQNFTDFDNAIEFVENSDAKLILKQNGSAPKMLNHLQKFDSGIDMIYHLESLRKTWSEAEWGPVDFDLMEVVEGMEVAASAFFNGHDWLRDSKGKVVGFLNFEHKKLMVGDLGSTTGEMGTLFLGVDETNKLFSDILLHDEITKVLKASNYRGVFDVNGCMTDDGFVGFEPTSRFGIPATSYEFIEGLEVSTGDLLEAMAKGKDTPIDVHKSIGMVVVVTAPPFPVDSDVEDRATSIGQKLWIIGEDKEPIDDFTDEQKKHIHLENFYKDDDGDYRVATKSGYLYTVTGKGEGVESVRDDILDYIKDNTFITDYGWRTDIGKKIEDYI